MKKITFLFMLVAALNSAKAQSLQFLEHGTSVPAQANYTLYEDAGVDDWDHFFMDVKNISASSLNYKIRKTLVSSPAGCATPNGIHFCDANTCYPPMVAVSMSVIPLTAGELNGHGNDHALTADIDAGTCLGTYIVRYCAFNVNNPTDSSSFTITYIVTPTGIQSAGTKHFATGAISPNPVSATATLKYDFATLPENASLKIYNTIGSLVKEIKLEGQEGKANIDLTNLSDGVYVYSLHVNDKTISTKKLIVAHN